MSFHVGFSVELLGLSHSMQLDSKKEQAMKEFFKSEQSKRPGWKLLSSKPTLAASEYDDHHILLVKQGGKGSPDTREENWAPPLNGRASKELAAVFNLTTVYVFMCMSVCACM